MYWNDNKHTIYKTITGLIETWDVLKWNPKNQYKQRQPVINRNMRCIEMANDRHIPVYASEINRNMRCIEIYETEFIVEFVY